jgi:Tfp pilus assembly protein PilF
MFFLKRKRPASNALRIDPSLGEGHLALARAIQLYDWNWPEVEKEYRRALELNQNYALAHNFYAEFLQQMGRNDEALEQTRRAVVLNPLDSNAAANLGFDNYTARKYDVAIQEFQKVLKFDPDSVGVHVGLGWVYEQKKMYPEAIVELQKAVTLSNRNELTLASLGQVLAESGRRHEAAKILQEMKHRSEQRYISPCLLAIVQIGLGERDQCNRFPGAGLRQPRSVDGPSDSGPTHGQLAHRSAVPGFSASCWHSCLNSQGNRA